MSNESNLARSPQEILNKFYADFAQAKIPQNIAQLNVYSHDEGKQYAVLNSNDFSVGIFQAAYNKIAVNPFLKGDHTRNNLRIYADEIKLDAYKKRDYPYMNVDIHLFLKGILITTIYM